MTNLEKVIEYLNNTSDDEKIEILKKIGCERFIKILEPNYISSKRDCNITDCLNCKFSMCFNNIGTFLKQEYIELKKFTEDEEKFLSFIDERFKWITRDKDGGIYIFDKKPTKQDQVWDIDLAEINYAFIKLQGVDLDFKSIKWEDKEPTQFRS